MYIFFYINCSRMILFLTRSVILAVSVKINLLISSDTSS